MSDDMQQDKHWHLDKRVPLALIVTLVLQSGAIIWWAAKADYRLEALERTSGSSATQSERIIRLEAKVDNVVDVVSELKMLLRPRSSVQ